MAGTATLEFTLGGGRATTWTAGVSMLAAAQTFAASIQPYTNAAISRVGFVESTELTNAERSDVFANMDIYGHAFFKDGEEKIVKFVWPAPRFNLFEIEDGRHKLKKINGDALATIIGMAINKALTFRHGGISTR